MERTVLPRADDPMLSSKTKWYFYDGGFVEAGKTPEETLGHWRNPNTVVVDGPPNYYDAKGNGSATWAPGYKQAVRDGVRSTFIPIEYRDNPKLWEQKQAEWARQSGNATVEYNYNNKDWETRGFYYGGGPDSDWDTSTGRAGGRAGGMAGGMAGGRAGKQGKGRGRGNKPKKNKKRLNLDFETSDVTQSAMPPMMAGSQCISRGPGYFQACCDDKATSGTLDPSCPARAVLPAEPTQPPTTSNPTPSPASTNAPQAFTVDEDDIFDYLEYAEYAEDNAGDIAEDNAEDNANDDAEDNETNEMNDGLDGFESFHHTLALAPGRIGQSFGSLWPGWYSWDTLPTLAD